MNLIEFQVSKVYSIPKAPQFDIEVLSISKTRKSMVVQVSKAEQFTVRISTSEATGIYHETAVPLSRFGSSLVMRAHWIK